MPVTRSGSSQRHERHPIKRHPITDPFGPLRCHDEPAGSAFRRHGRSINFASDASNHRIRSVLLLPQPTSYAAWETRFHRGIAKTRSNTSILVRTGESPRLCVLSPRHGNHTGDKRADHSFTQRDQGFEKSRDGGRGSRCTAEEVRRARGSGSRSTEGNPCRRFPTCATREGSRHCSRPSVRPRNPRTLGCMHDDAVQRFVRRDGNGAAIPSEGSARAASDRQPRTEYAASAYPRAPASAPARAGARQLSQSGCNEGQPRITGQRPVASPVPSSSRRRFCALRNARTDLGSNSRRRKDIPLIRAAEALPIARGPAPSIALLIAPDQLGGRETT